MDEASPQNRLMRGNNKMKTMKILAMVLAFLLVVGMVPISTFTALAATSTTRHIMLGTSDISGYDTTNGYDYIYYGNYEGEPVKWRVLDDQTNTGGAGLFLLSENLIGEGGEFGGIYFDTSETNIYQNSDAQIWCHSFYSTAFSQTEQREIIDTTKSDSAYSSSSGAVHFSPVNNILNSDKVFFLSAEEAENANYGFVDNSSRVAEYNRNAGYWWLRSPSSVYSDAVGYAKPDGSIFTTDAERVWAARPAFNFNTSKVLFTSAADGVTTNTNASEYLTSVGTYSGKEYKLTLLDESRAGFSVAEENMQVVKHQTVRVSFTGAGTGTNDYVSLFIVDENDDVLYYGSIAKSTDAAGAAEFEVPSDIPDGSYTIKIFSEQKNGANKTDYASPFDEITLTVGAGHKHCVCGGNTNIGDHTAHPDVEFTAWNAKDSMPTAAGNYVLMNDVSLNSEWEPVDGTVLCLNGHTLSTMAIPVKHNHQFTLCDCVGGGKIKESSPDKHMIFLFPDSTFNMYGGTVCGGRDRTSVMVSAATFRMYGGAIADGRVSIAPYDQPILGGGGVCLANTATFHMYGGAITNNQVINGAGGGVYIQPNASFTMHGGSITNNTAKETGGGIHNEGIFVMTGGEISGNRSTDSTGGGVWSAKAAPISISGDAVMTGNTGKGETNNLHLASDGTTDARITVGTMGKSASVGVSVDSNHGMVISDGGKNDADKFFSDDSDYVIAVDGEDLELTHLSHVWDTSWTSGNDRHWHKCVRDNCSEISDEALCSGGTATCTSQARCEFCDAPYGQIDSNNHKFSTAWTQTTEEHYHACVRCPVKTDMGKHIYDDEWDADCNTCGYLRPSKPPVITTQPAKQHVVEGQTATFTIVAQGNSLTYQWQINRNDGKGWLLIDSATSPTHTTQTVDPDCDGFQYRCIVSDPHGNTVESDAAVLRVEAVPVLPQTGDNSHPLLYLGLLLTSLVGLIVLKKRIIKA